MKLIELNPRWTGFGSEIINGITFDCPHCRTQRLGVTFEPPIDPNGWWDKILKPTYDGMLVWKRKGDTFETLTLYPSIDASSPIEFKNHWHGFVRNGEVF